MKEGRGRNRGRKKKSGLYRARNFCWRPSRRKRRGWGNDKILLNFLA